MIFFSLEILTVDGHEKRGTYVFFAPALEHHLPSGSRSESADFASKKMKTVRSAGSRWRKLPQNLRRSGLWSGFTLNCVRRCGRGRRIYRNFMILKSPLFCSGLVVEDFVQSQEKPVVIFRHHVTEAEILLIQRGKVRAVPDHQSFADAVFKDLMGIQIFFSGSVPAGSFPWKGRVFTVFQAERI